MKWKWVISSETTPVLLCVHITRNSKKQQSVVYYSYRNTILSVWDQLNFGLCIGPCMRVWCPWWLKMVQRYTLYLNASRYSLIPRARYMSFWTSNCQQKLHRTRFGWEMGCANFSYLFSQQLVNWFWPNLLTPVQVLPNFWNKKVWTDFLFLIFKIFLTVYIFWAFLLKIQTPISLSILEVRGA